MPAADCDERRREAKELDAQRRAKKRRTRRQANGARSRTLAECPHWLFPCDCPEKL